MGDITKILTGPVDIYVIAYGTTNDPVTANAVDWTGWTQLGFQTEDGLDWEYTAEWLDIIVAAHNAPVKRELIGEALMAKFSLQECSLDQLQYAIAGATYAAGAVAGTNPNLMTVGDKTGIVPVSFGFEGIAPTGEALVGFIPRVDPTGAVAMGYKKGSVREIPFEFTAQADTSRATGQTLGLLWELTSVAQISSTLDSSGADSGDVTLDLVDGSLFGTSGTVTVGAETGLAYTGRTSNQLTGVDALTTGHSPGTIVIKTA